MIDCCASTLTLPVCKLLYSRKNVLLNRWDIFNIPLWINFHIIGLFIAF